MAKNSMMRSKTVNLIGSMSVACSVPLWIYFLGLLSMPQGRPDWINAPVLHLQITLALLLIGLALSLLAVKLGSKGWLISTGFLSFSFACLWYFLAHLEL